MSVKIEASDSDNLHLVLCTLPSGQRREMSAGEAADMDTPEGTVTVTVSATLFKRLLEAYDYGRLYRTATKGATAE